MTRKEAITQLKMDRDLCSFNPMTGEEEPMNEDCRKSAEALEMAIKALERDTPMKVNIEKWIYTQCPSGCGYELSTHHGDGYYSIDKKLTFCPKCGQRLDWGCDND